MVADDVVCAVLGNDLHDRNIITDSDPGLPIR
jgi:hypothetical protein